MGAYSARVAQLVEHFHGKEGVVGSSPIPGFEALVWARQGNERGSVKLRRNAFSCHTSNVCYLGKKKVETIGAGKATSSFRLYAGKIEWLEVSAP